MRAKSWKLWPTLAGKSRGFPRYLRTESTTVRRRVGKSFGRVRWFNLRIKSWNGFGIAINIFWLAVCAQGQRLRLFLRIGPRGKLGRLGTGTTTWITTASRSGGEFFPA